MSSAWQSLISDLEEANRRLALAVPEDQVSLGEILEARGTAIRRLGPMLEHAVVPGELRTRLENIYSQGQALLVRLYSYRAALAAEWDSQSREAQWLRETSPSRRRRPHSVDCQG